MYLIKDDPFLNNINNEHRKNNEIQTMRECAMIMRKPH